MGEARDGRSGPSGSLDTTIVSFLICIWPAWTAPCLPRLMMRRSSIAGSAVMLADDLPDDSIVRRFDHEAGMCYVESANLSLAGCPVFCIY